MKTRNRIFWESFVARGHSFGVTPRNKDMPKLRDRLFRPAYRSLGAGRRTSAFLQDAFITMVADGAAGGG
ncbi:MAG: hypothetical protein Q7J98_09315 [Kiritimatiellia bacterium]|nr:hypothetical protein [Kiritimatiellia bacterium]